MLINKLIELFGVDSQNKGYYDLEKEINIDIREWNYRMSILNLEKDIIMEVSAYY